MAHLPIGGTDGSLLPLSKLPGRVLYTHLNNSNPVLDANSPEAAEVARAGVEMAKANLEKSRRDAQRQVNLFEGQVASEYSLEQGLKQTIDWFTDPQNLSRYKTDIYNV